MALNYIWIGFFLIAFVTGLVKLIFFGDMEVFPGMMSSTFSMAKTGFELSLGLTGVLTLWMGIMKIGEKGGIVKVFSKLIGPFFQKLFPELGKEHPATGSIMMNIAANMLGLDNAATPMGLKAMDEHAYGGAVQIGHVFEVHGKFVEPSLPIGFDQFIQVI